MQKNSKIILSVVLPEETYSENVKRSLLALKRIAERIQLLTFAEFLTAEDFAHFVILPTEKSDSFSKVMNTALPYAKGELLTFLQPGIEVNPNLPEILSAQLSEDDAGDYLYGNYSIRDEAGNISLIESNSCIHDITEREDWGLLEIYRVSALLAIGGCDENIRFRPDYHLRLELTHKKPAVHIRESLCIMPEQKKNTEVSAETLYYPGRGKYGGFSYLFMNAEEEREVEEIFYRTLKRRNAFLTDFPNGVFLPPKKTSPKVTVIIPVHNRAGFLPLAVQSVQRGTFSDFEIIIVDNASDDDTLKAAKQLADSDARIRVIVLEDNIIAKALNIGITGAKGEYIAQLDSDDEYMPETLEIMVKQLDGHLNWALGISYYELMDEKGNSLTEFGVIKHLEYNRNNILRVDGAGAVRIWRKAAIEEFGGFNEKDFGHYGEDYDLVLKVGEKYEVGRVHQVLYRYRRHPGNSDILRSPELKIYNKTLARVRAIARRQNLNRGLSHEAVFTRN